jgi:exonuclease SbcC
MLPLLLNIKGVYSYQKKQTINFQELTDAGLFGVFGAVGSGKSTILEAIGFVLYNQTERLDARDKRAYNMLNLKSNEAEIEFEFLNYQERKFKFCAEWSRKRTRYDEVSTVNRTAYEWKDEKWIPLSSVEAEPILGLSYENFRRTIIIPQGKFKEFLDLKGKERSEMMKDIFHLERFDLSQKVKNLKDKTDSEEKVLKGTLATFENVTTETIERLTSEFEESKKDLEKKKVELELLDKDFKQIETLKKEFEEFQNRKTTMEGFIKQLPDMTNLKSEIEQFEKTEKAFKISLDSYSLNKKEQESVQNSLFEKQATQLKLSNEINSITLILENLKEEYVKLDTRKLKVSDLDSILKVRAEQIRLEDFEGKISEFKDSVKLNEDEIEKIKDQIDEIQLKLKGLKENRVDASMLIEIGDWYKQEQTNKNKEGELEKQEIDLNEQISKIHESFSDLNLSREKWESELDQKKLEISDVNKFLIAEKTKLLLSKELAHYSNQLKEGENCPLCGSLEHPMVMHVEDVSERLSELETKVQLQVDSMRQLEVVKSEAISYELQLKQYAKTLIDLKKEKISLKSVIDTHAAKFSWKDFNPLDDSFFEERKKSVQKIENEIKELEKDEAELRLKSTEKANTLNQIQSELNEINNQKATIVGVLTNEKNQIKIVEIKDYDLKSVSEIQSERNRLDQENVEIENTYKKRSEEFNSLNEQNALVNGGVSEIEIQLRSIENTILKLEMDFSNLLKIHGFDSIENVVQILSKSWDITLEKQKWEKFNVEFKIAESAFNEYASKKLAFDETVYLEKHKIFTDQKDQTETSIASNAALDTNLKRLQLEYTQKEAHIIEYEKLKFRLANLTVLANMFNGNGFVNYVSSIYLKNLADIANRRFHRMTKHQLSLTINSNNEFEVIDYLNNGATRSVKTLSGGQGFQASLCLALSLAESVQSLNMSGKNFFFIDEGFGTQDAESVSIVFETLQSLNKENRIVGIISHVSELQERIPRSITIEKNDETGSSVRIINN